MKKSRRCGLGTTICRGLLFVLLAVCLHTAPKAYAEGVDLADANLNTSSVWTSGCIDETAGTNVTNKKRVRTSNYYVLGYDKYEVSVSSSAFTISAYYYDANKAFISSEKLYDGCVLAKKAEAEYVRFDYRHNTSEKSMSAGQFGRVIGTSLNVNFAPIIQHESNVSISTEVVEYEQPEQFEDVEFSSTTGLKSAGIDSKTGQIVTNKRRLSTEKYFPIYDQTLTVSISADGYKVEVYEYDENEAFIKMTVASDGTEIDVTDKTRFVRFSLYRVVNEKSLSAGQWGRIFGEGLSLSLTSDTEAEENEVYEPAPAPKPAPEPQPASTPHDELYNEMKQMLATGDTSRHDISKYGFDIYEVRAIADELKQGEGYYYFANSNTMFLSDFSLKNNICYTMRFEGMDSDFVNRYNRMMKTLDEIKSMTTSQMTDLDKVILVHEYIVTHTYYEKTSTAMGCAGGILGDGHGLCTGFARAFNAALKYIGVETRYASSNDMNHAWSLVKIDGQYYHVDCTWDDTYDEKYGYVGHYYFLASDTRFNKSIPTRHYNWIVKDADYSTTIKLSASSTKFDNWFVHDVKSYMVYSDGYWYYADGKTIKKSDAYGKDMSTVLTETGNVSIIGLSQGKLQYKVNGTVKTISVK
ncbi:MAG: hypothetical protein J5717_01480 [Lachnospiraceae bacterium]|nr:hypothetical protein [Lachnospiraceae bacterium]